MWKDGEPDRLLNAPNEYEEYFPSYIFSDGDDTVTINSAVVNGVENYMIAGSHGETISDQNAINQILTWLDVNYTIQPFDDITLEKIIALILHSPVNMSVENVAGQTVGYQSNPNQQIPLSFYDETAKVIIIGNPEDSLKIKLVGDSGIENQAGYDLAVLSENKMDNLEKYLLSDTIGPDEEKEYLLDTKKGSLNKEGDSSTPSFSSLKIKITNMINQIETADYLSRQQKKLLASSLSSTLAKIDLLEKYSKQKKYTTLNSQLNIIQSYLFRTRRLLNLYSKNSEYEKEMLKINQGFPDIFSDLFFIKLASLKQKPCYLSKKYLKLKLWQNEILFTVKKKKIERDAAKNHAYLYQSASLFLAENYFQKANHYSDNDKIEEALFYSELSRWFLGEI